MAKIQYNTEQKTEEALFWNEQKEWWIFYPALLMTSKAKKKDIFAASWEYLD